MPGLNKAEWDAEEKEVLRENTAQAIQEQLEAQDKLPTGYERRWIWELFQNALDASRDVADLEIKIHFDRSLTFSHNGTPFSRKEILHLIFHGSTKRESPEAIGRYGTGFLATHVLSRKVHVRGHLQTGEHFDFALDRTGATPADLMCAMEASRFQLLESASAASRGRSNWTEFEYPLSTPKSRELVRSTLSDLTTIAIAVISFNPRIRSIILSGSIQGSYELLSEKSLGNSCTVLRVGSRERKEMTRGVVAARGEGLAVLVFLGDQDETSSIQLPGDVPRIFVAFPLFGTEALPFPFVMNAPDAVPTENRNGLFLGAAEDEKGTNRRNKSLVEGAWKLYQDIVRLAAEHRWQCLYRLAQVTPSEKFQWLDNVWLDELLKKNAARLISDQALVETSSGDLLTPSGSVFPLGVPESLFSGFHALVGELYGGSVVRSGAAWDWNQNIEGWHRLALDSKLLEVTPDELVRKVSSLRALPSLREVLSSSVEPFDWLNRFLTVLVECKADWVDKNVLPDQEGRLTSRKCLSSDRGIAAELKDIAELLEMGLRNQLLDTRVTDTIQALLPPYDQEKLLVLLLNAVRTRKAKDYDAANVRLLHWLVRNRRSGEIKTYPFLLRARDKEVAQAISVAPGRVLAPPEVWPLTAQPFVDLFPPDCVLSSDYTTSLASDDWLYLSAEGVCFLDPLVRESRVLDSNELPLMAQDVQAFETGEHNLSAITVSDVTFLTLKDRGVLDTARASRSKSARFMSFLFRHIVPNVASDLAYNKISCTCGTSHLLHSAAWLVPVRERKWVHESRGHPAYVSPSSLAQLLREDESLMQGLSDDSILRFLARAGISPSELHRAALDLPEDQMAKLDKAVMELLAVSKNDPQRLGEIAELISSAPELLAEFEERKQRKERIRKNQQLGALVEELFRQLFSSREMGALGLRVRRTGVGSDYAFESDLVDDGQEQLFQLSTLKKELFVELKSTLSSSAKMTPTQAKKASSNPNNFVLCVVPLEDRNPTLELVSTASRFVAQIGKLLQPKVALVNELEVKKALATTETDGVQVLIDRGEVRYAIGESVWAAEMTASEFTKHLLSFFCPDDAKSVP